jgi:hypothetical protein
LDVGNIDTEYIIVEVEEDKHLDARHAIEEAMSGFLIDFVNTHLLMLFVSSRAYEKLSQVPERFVSSASTWVRLT